MKKNILFTALTFVLSAFVLTSCTKDGYSSPEEFIENPSVKRAINESGIPVNYGDAPPALAGTYSVNGSVTDASSEMYVLVGMPVQSEFVLSQQTNSGKINFEERIGGIRASGSGGYITGNNGRFTIYQESKQSGSEAGLPNDVSLTLVLMMSGTKSDNGNLTNVQGISIITAVNNASYKSAEGWWWKWDATFYLQTGY